MLTCLKTIGSPTLKKKKLPPFLSDKISCLSENQNLLLMKTQLNNSKRPTCPNCSKPLLLCLCTRLKTPNLDNKIHVTILQHSLERKHPLNSARIAKLGLKNVDVFNVTDVNFEAQFEIRSLGECTPGVCGNVSKSLVCDGSVLEGELCRNHGFDQVDEVDWDVGSVFGTDCERFPDGYCESIDEIGGKDSETQNDGPLMSVTIGKSGKIISVSHQWTSLHESETPEIEHLLDSPEAIKYLARGFIVKKLQNKEKKGSIELEEFEEFEITVPPGSVLLFPAQNALGVDAIGFQVKNLIVLDGTWSKAKRMYLENPWLRLLPSVRLHVEKLSLFSEVRRQPKPGYLSTIESIVCALEVLGKTEKLCGLDNLLEVFESMVKDQRRYKDESMIKLSST